MCAIIEEDGGVPVVGHNIKGEVHIITTQIREVPRENGNGTKLVCGQWKDGKLKKKFLVYKDGEVKRYGDAMSLYNVTDWEEKLKQMGIAKGL